MGRIITTKDLGIITRNVLEEYQRLAIQTEADLRRYIGQKFPVAGDWSGSVFIDERPSERDTTALVTRYVLSDRGIPLEGKLNPSLVNGVHIVIECEDAITGYLGFMTDSSGNKVQFLDQYGGFDEFRKEFEKLSKL